MQTALYQFGAPWDFGEHVRALRAVDGVTIRLRPWARVFRIAFPFVLIVVLSGSVLRGAASQPPLVLVLSLLPYLLLVGLWLGFAFWGQFYLAARRTRQLDPSTRGVLTRTLTADGFRIDGTGQAVDLRWEGIHSAVETSEFFLIFFNRLCAYYIPKRLIRSPQELSEMRGFLRSRLAERAILLSERAA